MQETAWIIIAVLGGGILAYLLLTFGKSKKKEDSGLELVLGQINELSRTLDYKLGETHKEMSDSLKYHSSRSNEIIRDVTERLTRLDETNKQVVSFADQLQNLQDILKNPKQRGILGEYYLETVLKNVLPPGSYQMQYKFKNGIIVDAAIFVKDKIIPVDSKFSLENYNRLVEEKDSKKREELEKQFRNDLKTRIDEASKYIKPDEGTMEFSFMFIPHEAIYYDLLVAQVGGMKVNTRDLIEYAFKERKVILVSPTSFLAFLQTVLQGLNALKIEKETKEIIKNVQNLGKHLKSYDDYHTKLGSSLATVVNHYNASNKELQKIDKDILKITDSSPGISQIAIQKPTEESE